MRLWPEPLETVSGLATAIRAGELSAKEAAERCIRRIQRLEHKLDAWAYIDSDDVMAQAAYLDRLAAKRRWLGPLHGVPIGIKDIIDVAGWPTGCGFPPWRERRARRDAWVVRRLRMAGAIILGKTVTTQFAAFDPPPTANPWRHDRTPGGSSSGSAAAVAAAMCPAALGTQTGGSILRPAAYCGVVGLKPTFGRVSVRGVFPFAPRLDHVGPITRSVRDAALLLDVLAGPDPRSVRSSLTATRTVEAYDAAVDRCHLRVGLLSAFFKERATEDAWLVAERAAMLLARSGARIAAVEEISAELIEDVLAEHRVIMTAEAAFVHRKLFARYRDEYAPRIGQVIEEGNRVSAAQYLEACRAQDRFRRLVRRLFDRYDLIITPATPDRAPDRSTTGPPVFQSPWSFAGVPTIALPARLSVDQLPLGVQLIANWGRERCLIRAAALVEHLLREDAGQ